MQVTLALKAFTGFEKNKKDVTYFLTFLKQKLRPDRLGFHPFCGEETKKRLNVNMKGMNAKNSFDKNPDIRVSKYFQ
jgi:hypothetical protein